MPLEALRLNARLCGENGECGHGEIGSTLCHGLFSPPHSFSFKRVRRTQLVGCNCAAENLFQCDLEVENAMRTCRSRTRFSRSIFPCAVCSAVCGEGNACDCCMRRNATQKESRARYARCDDLARAACQTRCSARPLACFFGPFRCVAELEQQ